MKNKIKLMLVAFIMCLMVVPSVKAKAASGDVWQTAASSNAVNIQWTNTYNSEVSYYAVLVDDDVVVMNLSNTTNSYTVTGLLEGSVHKVGIVGLDSQGKLVKALNGGYYIKIVTKPSKTEGVAYADLFGFDNNTLFLGWKQTNQVDGYEVVLYNKKGKAIQTVEGSVFNTRDKNNNLVSFRGVKFYNTNAQNVYMVKVRGYLKNQSGEKVYGDFSNPFYAVPQPVSKSTKKDVSRYAFNFKWKKVKGASQYIVYGSTSPESGYKKIATLKSSKSSYKATKVKGKAINTVSKTYYFKVVAVAKFGKKKVKSMNNGYVGAHTTIRYVYR